MIQERGIYYRVSRQEAAARFIQAFLEIPEKDRDRLVGWWNDDVKRKGSQHD